MDRPPPSSRTTRYRLTRRNIKQGASLCYLVWQPFRSRAVCSSAKHVSLLFSTYPAIDSSRQSPSSLTYSPHSASRPRRRRARPRGRSPSRCPEVGGGGGHEAGRHHHGGDADHDRDPTVSDLAFLAFPLPVPPSPSLHKRMTDTFPRPPSASSPGTSCRRGTSGAGGARCWCAWCR